MPTDTIPSRARARAAEHPVSALSLVGLPLLMEITEGDPSVTIALIDGPVARDHADLVTENIQVLHGTVETTSSAGEGVAGVHGTFVAGILHARRDSQVRGVCPGCTLLVRSIFSEAVTVRNVGSIADTDVGRLVAALYEVIEAGARIINLSVGLAEASRAEAMLDRALDHAARLGVVIVAAAGNEAMMGSSSITRHPGVIPVIGCDFEGQPLARSTFGASIGRRGLAAPGQAITSLAAAGGYATFSGSSAAVPFVSGALGLLWSEFPNARASQVRSAIAGNPAHRRSVAPPRLDAWAAYQTLRSMRVERQSDCT